MGELELPHPHGFLHNNQNKIHVNKGINQNQLGFFEYEGDVF